MQCVDLGGFNGNGNDNASSGSIPNIAWTSSDQSVITGGAGVHWGDSIGQVTLTVTNPSTVLTIGFGSSLNQPIYDESWGIDNLKITANTSANISGKVTEIIDTNNAVSYTHLTLPTICSV